MAEYLVLDVLVRAIDNELVRDRMLCCIWADVRDRCPCFCQSLTGSANGAFQLAPPVLEQLVWFPAIALKQLRVFVFPYRQGREQRHENFVHGYTAWLWRLWRSPKKWMRTSLARL
jgi:hypothetical protein